ncbi:helix-turn-helix domain-containing protein [Sulfobacillus thermosulfidooxidans]|uniref:helix-turn-helix domain-containing protein n=1 Tax=Sulfobacillus thermosulfidooxidans TaxID=28034 RepID=UPI0006B4CA07|nr:helix-turn-helix domain-containing protein [Sulfobacillus thermosulfidooxidans]
MVPYDIPPATMEKLLAVARTLTSHRDLDGVLHDLLQSSLDLIPGADFACVFLYDPHENALIPVGGVGFDLNIMKAVRLKPGESLTGKAFSQRRAVLLPTPEAIRRAQSNLSPEHDQLVRQAVGRPSNPVRSSVAAPLIIGEKTVGVLVVDNYDTDRDFNERDLAVVTALADHAAVAVANAQEHARRKAISQELQKTLNIQKQLLASLVTEKEGLTGLTQTLWRQINHRSISVHDWNHRLVARMGEMPTTSQSYIVQAGGQKLGTLDIGGGPLTRLERVAVDQALLLYAIELLRQQSLERERRHIQTDLFHRILEGDQFSVNALANQYHLSNQVWEFVLIGMLSQHGELSDAIAQEWMDWLNHFHIPHSVMQNTIVLILTSSNQERFQHYFERRQGSWLSIWSERQHHVLAMSDEFASVLRLWRFFQRYPLLVPSHTRAIRVRDFPEVKIWESVPKILRDEFVQQVLGPIGHDEILLSTLRAWIFSNRSYSAASQVLQTHPNTVRYRMDKISHLLGRSLDNDRDVMLLRMALIWEGDWESLNYAVR